MIGSLQGIIRGTIHGTVVVEVGGVGYRVFVPVGTLAKIKEGDSAFLWTHHAQRETAQDLYGFETKEELAWFELLLTVSGIGPRSALSILNAVDGPSLERAILTRDAVSLSKAHGVGKKTAEKIVLELREKVGSSETLSHESGSDGDVIDALVGLGYSQREAREAARSVSRDITETGEKIREAIRIASRTP